MIVNSFQIGLEIACLLLIYQMEELDLSGNSIGNDGIGRLSQLISKKHLGKLRLAKCYITANQLKVLSEGINKMKGTMVRILTLYSSSDSTVHR